MFTGIIETLGQVVAIRQELTNVHFTVQSSLSSTFKIDQSVAHNGVCLTVVAIEGNTHTVTAIDETLKKTNLSDWQVGTTVNIERCMQMNGRLDGHIVQGHVDQVGKCVAVEDQQGSWLFTFQYEAALGNVTIEKGSITVNGTSLTVVNSQSNEFSVAIIPYTLEHTNFKDIKVNTVVNLEFDVIGKYVKRLMEQSC